MMVARIDSLQVAPELIDEMVSHYRERENLRHMHLQAQGLLHQYWLVDRHSGQIKIIGLWESQEDIDAAIPILEPARERLWSEFQEALQETHRRAQLYEEVSREFAAAQA